MYKKLSFLLFLFIVITFNSKVYSQAPALAIQKNFGGSSAESFYSIKSTADGGFIAAGSTQSVDGDVTGNHGNNNDAWVIKTDSNLNVQWKKCYGGSSSESIYEIIQKDDGSYIFIGTAGSNDFDVSGVHGSGDVWVVRLDAAGNLLWQHCYGGIEGEMGRSISLTDDGGFIAAGESKSNDGDVSGHHGGSFDADYWVFKADSTGAIQWQKSLGGTRYESAKSVRPSFDGGYIVCGNAASEDGDVTGFHTVLGNYPDYWVVKLDSAGNLQWQKCLGGTGIDYARIIIQTIDSAFIVAGTTGSDDGDVSPWVPGSPTGWVVKLDTTGTVIWKKLLGVHGEDINSMLQAPDGGFIAGGSTWSDGNGVNSNGFYDFWIVKTDSACNIQWQRNYGGTDYDFGDAIDFFPGGYVVTGNVSSHDVDLNSNKGGYDAWIVKVVSHSNSITGQVYLDTVSNGMHDAGEPLLSNKLITEATTGRMAFTDENGIYNVSVLTAGSFNVQAPVVNNYTITPSAYPVTFSSIDETDSLNDFPAAPIPGINDLQITLIPVTDFSVGFSGTYWLVCKNTGTTTQSATVKLFPGNYISYANAGPVPSLITADSIVWSGLNMVPWQEIIIMVSFTVNLTAPVDSLISTSSQIEPVISDLNPADNYSGWRIPVTASSDPNDKLVSDTLLTTTEMLTAPWLDYIIRFQNTGTDTAVNIKVTDNISYKLQLNTFELLNTSHPVQAAYQDVSRLITFNFNNIQLPDSGVNEPASHGFIHYRIRTYDTLSAGDIIKNHAAIFFDFNEPVITKTARTRIVLPTSAEEYATDDFPVMIFPNPASTIVNIQTSEDVSEIKIYDFTGRALIHKIADGNSFLLDVSTFNSGIYFLQMISDKKKVNKKFMVQH